MTLATGMTKSRTFPFCANLALKKKIKVWINLYLAAGRKVPGMPSDVSCSILARASLEPSSCAMIAASDSALPVALPSAFVWLLGGGAG